MSISTFMAFSTPSLSPSLLSPSSLLSPPPSSPFPPPSLPPSIPPLPLLLSPPSLLSSLPFSLSLVSPPPSLPPLSPSSLLSLLTLKVEDSAHNPLQHDGEAIGEGQVREQVLTHEQFQENDPKRPHIHLLGAGQGVGFTSLPAQAALSAHLWPTGRG